MKKRILTLALALILGISAIPAAAASSLAANPTASTVYVNGAATAFEAYNIGGNNYFKLRDLAYALNGTAKQFEVGYDNATMAITLTSGQPYTPAGGEMARGDGTAKTASPTASRIYFDGRELNLTVYIIGGNNFFKLRDLMEVLDVFVGYDNATRAITLDTSKGYVPEGAATPTPTPEPTPTPIPTPAPSSSIDARLLGFWVRSIGTSDYRYYQSFKDDGSYSYIQISGSLTTTVTGRYSASGGKVYLTNLVDDMNRIIKDQSMSYSYGTDSEDEFLSIATVWFALADTDEEPQEMSPTQFWRSQ